MTISKAIRNIERSGKLSSVARMIENRTKRAWAKPNIRNGLAAAGLVTISISMHCMFRNAVGLEYERLTDKGDVTYNNIKVRNGFLWTTVSYDKIHKRWKNGYIVAEVSYRYYSGYVRLLHKVGDKEIVYGDC